MAPFVRLGNGAGREGTGLGLSLAAAVARLHGGALRLQDNHPGLRALLDLPLRPPAGAPMSAATPAA
jgi:signal transduction histidine kinase